MLARLKRTLLIATALLISAAGGAQADLYAVDGIPVDVRAESASAAQQRALAQGRAAALRKVMQRLTRESDHGRLPTASDADIQAMVTSLQVSDEKTAPDRYIATLSFQFAPDPVRDLLRNNQLQFTESQALPVLIVPVLTVGGEASIWTDPNPWLNAWSRLDGTQSLVPPAVPFGDVEDVVLLSAEQALAGDEGSILALARRYDAETALVFDATMQIDAASRNAQVDVRMRSYGTDSYQPIIRSFQGSVANGATPFLMEAARTLMEDVERQWKSITIEQFADLNEITALVPVNDLDDWLQISGLIDRVHLVRQKTLKALTVRDALITLSHGGSPESLQRAMARIGLDMQQQPDGFWLLVRRGVRQ
ncbi:DUF2066 domain-containing protein [Minwuia sp.]|uniref:DUF2066 domain-containing protein n=1 Tax=Minwuia sp. TaxID=2493630 RepID=UPI003A92BC1D